MNKCHIYELTIGSSSVVIAYTISYNCRSSVKLQMENQRPSQKTVPNKSELWKKVNILKPNALNNTRITSRNKSPAPEFIPHPPTENMPLRRRTLLSLETGWSQSYKDSRHGSVKSTQRLTPVTNRSARGSVEVTSEQTISARNSKTRITSTGGSGNFEDDLEEKENTAPGDQSSENRTRRTFKSDDGGSRRSFRSQNSLDSVGRQNEDEEEDGKDTVILADVNLPLADLSIATGSSKVATKMGKKPKKPKVPELPYVPGPPCFVFIEIGDGDKFLLNPDCAIGLINEYIYKNVKHLTCLPVERCMKENTLDLVTPTGAFLGLDAWGPYKHCPNFEARETYIPVVWSRQEGGIADGRYLFLECIHTDLEEIHPEVDTQLKEMFQHSTNYKQELARKLKEMLAVIEQQSVEEEHKLKKEEEEERQREKDRKKAETNKNKTRQNLPKTAYKF